jgi:hypothetical protein
MEKENPVKIYNRNMQKMYAHHLCLHCEYLNYWDWYICRKRMFTLWDFSIKELIKMWWRHFIWNFGSSLNYLIQHFFDIDQFIPDKPIKKCRFYEHSDHKVFWTKIVEKDGTVWTDDGEEKRMEEYENQIIRSR